MQYQVITTGRRLWTKDVQADLFDVFILNEKLDFDELRAEQLNEIRETGRIYKYDKDLFGEASWVQVMMGQGIMPKTYHPIVDLMPQSELAQFLGNIKTNVARQVQAWPPHYDIVQHYCKSRMM
mgnify:CR=1 FL=1